MDGGEEEGEGFSRLPAVFRDSKSFHSMVWGGMTLQPAGPEESSTEKEGWSSSEESIAK